LRESGAASQVLIDCITLMPLAYAATFYGYHYLAANQPFIDDSSLARHNMRTAAATGETMSHTRHGGPLLLQPGRNSRLFFYATDAALAVPIAYEADLIAYYYPRVRLL
jgi:hypothetical protein